MSVKGGGHCTDFVLYNGKDHPWVKILHPGFCRPAFSISLIFSCQSIFPIISMRGNFSKNSLILPNGGHPESIIFPRKQNKIILRLYITYCVPSKCRYHWLFIPHVCGTRNVTIIYTMIPPPYKWWNEGATWSAAADPGGSVDVIFPERHFQMPLHEWKVLYFDTNFTKFCSIGSHWLLIALVQWMAWHGTGHKPLLNNAD